MKLRYAFGLVAALALSGCQAVGVPAPQTPAQAVFEAKGGELAAITLANQYKALPRCPGPVLCSQASVVALLQKSANATDAALDAAQATVTDPNFKDSPAASKAAIAAQNALDALVAITSQLKVK